MDKGDVNTAKSIEGVDIKESDGDFSSKAAYAMNEVSYAATLRKLGRFSAAEESLKDAVSIRYRLFPELGIIHFHTIIHLAYVMRD